MNTSPHHGSAILQNDKTWLYEMPPRLLFEKPLALQQEMYLKVLIRILFKSTRMLFYELVNELTQ